MSYNKIQLKTMIHAMNHRFQAYTDANVQAHLHPCSLYLFLDII